MIEIGSVLPVSLHASIEQREGVPRWPLPNAWLGVSVENQAAANERIPHLLKCPAAVRFLSCEPLLGPIDLFPLVITGATFEDFSDCCIHSGRGIVRGCHPATNAVGAPGYSLSIEICGDRAYRVPWSRFRDGVSGMSLAINWVISGCESQGTKAGRFADGYEEAAFSLMHQCNMAGVPFFHKQMPVNGRVSHDPAEWPADLRVRQFPAPATKGE